MTGPAGDAATLSVPDAAATYKIRTRADGVTYWSDPAEPGSEVTIDIPAPILARVSKAGEALPGQRVHLFYGDGSYAGVRGRTTPDGQAATLAVPEAGRSYKVRTRLGGVTYWSPEIQPGTHSTIDIPADILVAVEVDGQPLGEQRVHLFYDGGTYAGVWSETGPQGEAAALPVPDGVATYKVRTRADGDTYWSEKVASGASWTIEIYTEKIPPITSDDYAHDGEWMREDAHITLSAEDDLSGVASTFYRLDGGEPLERTQIDIAAEGQHTVSYWSVDVAGNVEVPTERTVLIDKTAPVTEDDYQLDGEWTNQNAQITLTPPPTN
jgi:hypothetical protein